jgi:hypothetical protein
VHGNLIGTNAGGTADLGNTLSGVKIEGNASSNTIGGNTAAARNIISGNNEHGVFLVGTGVTGNLVQGNYIGTAFNGTAALGNTLAGVRIANASSNSIGGTASGVGNTIAFNGQNGVRMTGLGTGNAILRNSIFLNIGLGIDLNGDGVTANDANDPDTGPNKLQNFPVITSAILSGGNLTVSYSVPSVSPNSTFPLRVEFFIADPGQEGKTILRADSYAAPGVKMDTFAAGGAALGSQIVATATDANGNTSEFSAGAVVSQSLQAAGGAASQESRVESPGLEEEQLGPIVAAAMSRLTAQGFSTEQLASLSSVKFAIADLPAATLGLATPQTIVLDINAAGYGWFIDTTPLDWDYTWPQASSLWEHRQAGSLSPRNRMDVLTAVLHELGHLLAHDDEFSDSHLDDIMSAALTPGIRKTSFADAVDAVFAAQ